MSVAPSNVLAAGLPQLPFPAGASNIAPDFVLQPGYQIIFAEDFVGPFLNASVWGYEVGDGSNTPAGAGWGTSEIESYVADSVQFNNGSAAIAAWRDATKPQGWAGTRIASTGRFSFTYGRVDARIYLPVGVDGAFPAFWMLPEINNWPQTGEIDIIEYNTAFTKNAPSDSLPLPQSINNAMHCGVPNLCPNPALSFYPKISQSGPIDGWHIYSLQWEPNLVTYLRDGVVTGTYGPDMQNGQTYWPYDKPFHFILNMAVQPSWSNKVANNVGSMSMFVDWIRVSQKTG